jgi:predicted PurR-regulated permease PerM
MALYPREAARDGELELFAKKTAIVVALILAIALLWRLREVLLLVFIAAILAAGIAPAVHRVRVLWRFWFHRDLARGAAVLLVYFPFLFVVLLLVGVVVPRLIVEARALGAQLPSLIETSIIAPLERYFPMRYVHEALHHGISLPRASVLLYVRSTATVIAEFIAVLFMVVYMLMDAHRLRNVILLFYPAAVRAERRNTLNRMAARMSSWLVAQLILSAMMGAAIFATLLVLRVPFALPLAILAMIGELVPVIGPILGCSPALIMALLHSHWQFWSLLIVVVVLQKLENLFVAPRVMARKVSISPLTAFIAFMSGAAVLGVPGAIIAIPLAAIVQVAWDEAFVERRERRQDIDRAGTLLRRVD